MDKKLKKIHQRILKMVAKGENGILEFKRYVDDLIDRGDYYLFENYMEQYHSISIQNYVVENAKNVSWNAILFNSQTTMQERIKRVYDKKSVYQLANDIYLDTISVTISNPLSSTFSTTGLTPSIFIDENMNLTKYDSDIFNIIISDSNWDGLTPSNIEKIKEVRFGTASSVKLDIENTYTKDYLITTEQRPNYQLYNYKTTVNKDIKLGTIEEIETVDEKWKYYYLNEHYAKFKELKVTFLKATKESGTYSIITASNDKYNEDQNLAIRYGLAIDYLKS